MCYFLLHASTSILVCEWMAAFCSKEYLCSAAHRVCILIQMMPSGMRKWLCVLQPGEQGLKLDPVQWHSVCERFKIAQRQNYYIVASVCWAHCTHQGLLASICPTSWLCALFQELSATPHCPMGLYVPSIISSVWELRHSGAQHFKLYWEELRCGGHGRHQWPSFVFHQNP